MKAQSRRLAWAATVALLVIGVCATAATVWQAAGGGYFCTGAQHFETGTTALKSDEIDVRANSAHAADPDPDLGELARVRIVVEPVDPAVPLFVGIGPRERVEEYLRGSAHEEFVSATLRPFRAVFRETPGAGRAADPAAQPFWVATSSGTGRQTLAWNKTHGAWSVVVMRLDGRSGVDVRVSVGLRFGFLPPVGVGTLAVGALLPARLRLRRPPSSGTDA
ncbi:hypothetical protein AB0M28_39375 [Streptomyces sp. NPDC051940]|uniref:hypothetical protein n=1 Tax=Streptomyces sp. NPDC051940 TaxID=3155675 RepID=UPI00342BEF01